MSVTPNSKRPRGWPRPQTSAIVSYAWQRPTRGAAWLWERFNGGFWTLLDQGAISLGTFLVNVELARQLDAPEYGTFALLLGGFFLFQHFNASLIYYPLMLKLAGGKQERPSDLVFVSLILTALSTSAFSAVVASCLIVFGRPDIAFAAAVYLVLWQLQDALRRALLAQFSYQVAAIADGIAYIGAAAGIAILAEFSQPQRVKRALCDGRHMRAGHCRPGRSAPSNIPPRR